jgi:diguanylate cyclase (GGDEF)-like protein
VWIRDRKTNQDAKRLGSGVGRYGGEEFVVIIPETDLESAQRKLEGLREQVAGTPIELAADGERIQVTISAGLASFPQDGEEAAQLFALADERMFQAKKEGRNRVLASREVVLTQEQFAIASPHQTEAGQAPSG